ncbi:MAG TPA: hypothetical protein VM688_04360, partial [Nocardioidaceae bacterium]|nr:hypothetical protein [Nocardioidaceae bacterium]
DMPLAESRPGAGGSVPLLSQPVSQATGFRRISADACGSDTLADLRERTSTDGGGHGGWNS